MQDQLATFAIRTPTAGITTVAGTPVTALQYVASATNTAELLYISISQSGSTTSVMDQVRVVRKTAPATVTAVALGAGLYDATGNAGGAGTFRGVLTTTGTGYSATAEGSDGDEHFRFNLNVLAGYEKDWQPNARIWIPVNGIIAVKIKAVVALTYDVTMVIREMK